MTMAPAQEGGRKRVIAEGAVPLLVALLASPDARVQGRAVGALQNLSSEPKAIRAIRRTGGIPLLVALLSSPALHTAGSAAGTLQNVGREVASRLLIRCKHTWMQWLSTLPLAMPPPA